MEIRRWSHREHSTTTTATVAVDRAEAEQALAVVDKVVVVVGELVITLSTMIDMMEMTNTAGIVKATVEAARPRAVRRAETVALAGRRVDLAARRRKAERVSELLA
jgi:hypothetical protein